MKKRLLFITAMCYAFLSYGQVYLSEDFSSGTMPPAGWSFDGYPAQWFNSATNKAGGTAPEAMFKYIQVTSGTSRFISPVIDLTGVPDLTLSFQHFYDYYDNGCSIGVATRFGTGAWTSVWQVSPTGNLPAQTKVINLTGVGQPDFQFCLYITGNLYNVDYWYIDDIKLYIPLTLDAKLKSVNLPSYVAIGAALDVKGVVSNEGSTPVTSFDVAYSVNGGTSELYSVSGINLALGAEYSFTHNTPIVINDAGTYSIVTNIQNVNGTTDMDQTNDTLLKYVGAVPFIPAKKVFAEEATGTWCGWCVRGICFMDYMAETYPNTWIGVAVHNGDPMVVTAYDAAMASIIPNFPGYPSGTIDRSGSDYYDPSDFEAGYLSRINAISPATIDIVNFAWDTANRVVSFDLQSEFVVDVNNELRYAVVISEDSLWGTGTTWRQTNYYAGGGNGPMCGFESMPATIPAASMHYDHVARAIMGTPYGTAGSLPSGIVAGSVHSYHYSYTIPASWKYDKLKFIGILIDMSTGEVLNANNVISSYVDIKEKNPEQGISVYPNPFNNFTNIEFSLNKASVVKVEVSNFLGKTIYSENAREYPNGTSKIQINSSNMSSGVYLIKLTIGNQTYSRKVSVVK
jgi:hypothetical protein